MNPHAQWRVDFARRLVPTLATFPGLQAAIVAGSVARGYADARADLEIPLFWEKPPSDETRLGLVKALGGQFLYEYDGPANEDQIFINGLQVDFWQCTVPAEEEVIARVLANQDVSLGNSNFMDTLRACIPLYGDEIIARWKSAAQGYPSGLAEASIRASLPKLRIRELELFAARDQINAFYSELDRIQRAVFMILLGLNQRYFPTFKWMEQVLTEMPIQPAKTGARFRRAYEVPMGEAVPDMLALLLETLALVEAAHPNLDTRRARRDVAITRPRIEPPGATA